MITKMNKISSVTIQALTFYAIVISTWGYSESFTDYFITPKWYFSILGILLAIILYSIKRILRKECHISASSIKWYIITSVCTQAMYELSLKLGLHITSVPHTEAGFFENPAGFASCMSIGFPFIGTLLYNLRKSIRITGYVLLSITAIATALSSSRAGIISIATICTIWLYRKKRISSKLIKYTLPVILSLLLAYCYWVKKDSADGRLLIWICSIKLLAKSPLWGHGIGGFDTLYMDIQADYFRKRGVFNHFALLADNIKHPFNEYLNIAIKFGLSGLSILLFFMAWLYLSYKKHPNREKSTAIYALTSISTFSFFSYPFTYPFTWIVSIYCIYVIMKDYTTTCFRHWTKRIIHIIIFICSFICITTLSQHIYSEKKWKEANNLILLKKDETALSLFKELKNTLGTNPYFLYNYAVILQKYGMYEKSLAIALSCKHYLADYDLELVLGENYTHTGDFKKAETHYLQASWMCPSRFLPSYKLLLLYKKIGHHQKAKEIAIQIIHKPIKHKTPEVLLIKREAEITLKRSH